MDWVKGGLIGRRASGRVEEPGVKSRRMGTDIEKKEYWRVEQRGKKTGWMKRNKTEEIRRIKGRRKEEEGKQSWNAGEQKHREG